jgi:hypothetical protein
VFRPHKTLKKTRIKFHNTLALPAVLYSCETWTIKARDARRITAAEMKYVRIAAGYIWTDQKANTEIAKELNITRFGQNTGLKEKSDATCKYNAP